MNYIKVKNPRVLLKRDEKVISLDKKVISFLSLFQDRRAIEMLYAAKMGSFNKGQLHAKNQEPKSRNKKDKSTLRLLEAELMEADRQLAEIKAEIADSEQKVRIRNGHAYHPHYWCS